MEDGGIYQHEEGIGIPNDKFHLICHLHAKTLTVPVRSLSRSSPKHSYPLIIFSFLVRTYASEPSALLPDISAHKLG
jgi:hypothetical protein